MSPISRNRCDGHEACRVWKTFARHLTHERAIDCPSGGLGAMSRRHGEKKRGGSCAQRPHGPFLNGAQLRRATKIRAFPLA